jgi:hypothetical protein
MPATVRPPRAIKTDDDQMAAAAEILARAVDDMVTAGMSQHNAWRSCIGFGRTMLETVLCPCHLADELMAMREAIDEQLCELVGEVTECGRRN